MSMWEMKNIRDGYIRAMLIGRVMGCRSEDEREFVLKTWGGSVELVDDGIRVLVDGV